MYYLLDKELNFICPIEAYKSMIWTTRYYKSGDFELYAPATIELISLIKKDYYVVRDDDLTQAMIIKNIQITTDAEEGNFLIVTGKSLKSILRKRIIWKQTTLNGNVETCIRRLINENIINPIIFARKIDNFILGAELGITETMRQQFTGDNLEDAISSICINHGLGYDVLLDLENKQFIFILFKGTDRSYGQTKNPHVVFSKEYENLLSTNYLDNGENYKNVALVAGEGEGVDRKTAIVGDASGMDRYELFVDSRDISTNSEEPITDAEYSKLLITKGEEVLSENSMTESIDGDLEANHTWQYDRDYFLGDIVEVIDEYGHSMRPQIIETIESENDTGKNLIVTFATEIETEG